jgi:flagellar hook assembly protein FlgD
VRLEVYDVSGRRVRVLLAGSESAGPHEVAWDGCDDMGRPVASGVYFMTLEAGETSVSGKAVLLR